MYHFFTMLPAFNTFQCIYNAAAFWLAALLITLTLISQLFSSFTGSCIKYFTYQTVDHFLNFLVKINRTHGILHLLPICALFQ